MKVLDKISKSDLLEFLEICSNYIKIDINKLYNITLNLIKYYNKIPYSSELRKEMKMLEDTWYLSLKKNSPDYSVYNNYYYLCDLWVCWVMYSRKYLKALISEKSLITKSIISDIKAKRIVDLGCGFGYTTAAIKQIFPTSEVFATNVEQSYQYEIAYSLSKKYNFRIYPDIKSINNKVDLFFASEYFEHFQEPVNHLIEILDIHRPKYMIIANAFNTYSIGHFNNYIYNNNNNYTPQEISKIFNNTLRYNNYEKVKTKLWNNRPTYWRLKKLNNYKIF